MCKGWQWLSLVTLVFLLSGPMASAVKANQRIPTALTITSSSSSVESGNSIILTATLKDSDGNPLSGKTIMWRLPKDTDYTPGTHVGSLRPIRGVTDSRGQATTTYTATAATPHIGVTIWASFGEDEFTPCGDEFYEGARAECHIQVLRAAGDTTGNIEDATGAPLWIWITLIILLIGSAFIERRLVRG